jgi:putative zinc finger/helix-turn-helix YgiT family protein
MAAKTKKAKRCWKCGEGTVTDSTFHARRKIGGQVFVADLPARQCTSCGEKTVGGPDLLAFDAAVASELARTGASSPEALKFLRKSMALTAAELGELLALRPETISRLENGKMPVDRRTAALLGLLALDHFAGRTETADRLRALARRPKVRKRVEVKARVA